MDLQPQNETIGTFKIMDQDSELKVIQEVRLILEASGKQYSLGAKAVELGLRMASKGGRLSASSYGGALGYGEFDLSVAKDRGMPEENL
ncbi:MAG: hypothetical protein UR39_C0007G0033 [Candidatus Woesebacteria bacterium GW2011_GWA1_33_30]|uniref:Uncharacterized protein n=1 Tax=Candidatus Woesebacteria bacterium GW2011_GWA2_33_28 TaxID=1618561 RepID=A0A0G0C6N0_9BACT|nr:MAG: hypothetical protein UR38_C0007G0033 [Candidatus Woesebacteria bacterium GW2011_GWA2_33_28]KKP47815.1 MAG: hypothetical protein UR39_C0007G0033 [Candidatus Woesebacteria bacterium GW2011_GWA1_33_30]KKP49260.1 MAG: hypothetical protein UR40_C0008G0033 [Microgenomates group bacterium GW2011_GWC1_33_32]KKP51627.1 MAG: hypothetical protein UR44_C0008G0029 [Candidatus Woesebacteria bacterium GW2011_GWB1_33_38]KKP57640.1 MAG: hypothetical protein UR48_C0013G0015 [Microgenomates group bacteriu